MRRHLVGAGMRETLFVTDALPRGARRGTRSRLDGPVPVEPLDCTRVRPGWQQPPSRRSRTFCGSPPRTSRTRRSRPCARCTRRCRSTAGWTPGVSAGPRFDWEDGPVWGWDGVVSGERSVLRIVPDRQAAVVLLTNGSTGRAMYRSLFAELMESSFGIGVSPSAPRRDRRARPVTSRASRASTPGRTGGWRSRTAGSRLLIEDEDGVTEALPLDERTFLVDAADPDNPTVTFGAFDAAPAGRRCSTRCCGDFHASTGERGRRPTPSCHVAHARRPRGRRAGGHDVGTDTWGGPDPVATSARRRGSRAAHGDRGWDGPGAYERRPGPGGGRRADTGTDSVDTHLDVGLPTTSGWPGSRPGCGLVRRRRTAARRAALQPVGKAVRRPGRVHRTGGQRVHRVAPPGAEASTTVIVRGVSR